MVVLTLVVHFGWELLQLDINNAFVNGNLEDNVYMVQPLGFVDAFKPHHMCKLRKSLYSLKQASHVWYHKLNSCLLS